MLDGKALGFADRLGLTPSERELLAELIRASGAAVTQLDDFVDEVVGAPVELLPTGGAPGATGGPAGGVTALPGRYEHLGTLGVGGMGEVLRVRDRLLNRDLAMKVLRAELVQNRQMAARFVEEAQATAQLEHPGIVPVHDFGRLPDGRVFFTMKEIRGRTLGDVIREVHEASRDRWAPGRSGYTFRRLLEAFRKVCDAVGYAHTRGVVHRDLKPDNVMVGSFGEILVVDWGIAKVTGRADLAIDSVVTVRTADDTLRTRFGAVAGTPAYMAPEQAAGRIAELGPRSDVYALGGVLYEILSGRPPYQGRTAQEVLQKVLVGPPDPPGPRSGGGTTFQLGVSLAPAAAGPAVPLELVEICATAMAREPRDRPSDATALGELVGAWLEGARLRDRADELVAQADALAPQVARLRRRADALRAEAAALLEGVRPWEPVERKRPAWDRERDAAELGRQAELREVEMLQLLRGALLHVPDHTPAHDRLADHYRAGLEEAERARDPRAAARNEALLRSHDTGRHSDYLRGEGAVTLLTEPPGAEVDLYRYVERDRRLVAERAGSLGRTPIVDAPLPQGSYLLRLRAAGRAEVAYPVHVARGARWDGRPPGADAPAALPLPEDGTLGEGDGYVPAGWFACGGDPGAAAALARRRVWVDGFVLRRDPVTHAEFIAFLDDLVARGREEDALAFAPRRKTGSSVDAGPVLYGRREDGAFCLKPDTDGDVWSPTFPVFLVDWHAAAAYARWEAERTGHAWRLPSELEWEKAARGVDGRLYPWGDAFDATWCCTRESRPGRPYPAEVDAWPDDVGPYGHRGLAGNVEDWCLEPFDRDGPAGDGERLIIRLGEPAPETAMVRRGGSWAGFSGQARAESRLFEQAQWRAYFRGFRLARSYP